MQDSFPPDPIEMVQGQVKGEHCPFQFILFDFTLKDSDSWRLCLDAMRRAFEYDDSTIFTGT